MTMAGQGPPAQGMTLQEHIRAADELLDHSDREFEAGDVLQGSEKLWGAACHAVIAVAQQRQWAHRSHRDMKNAVERLASQHSDPLLASGFAVAEKFHRNFYHSETLGFELDADRPKVHAFVRRAMGLAG